MRVRKVYRMLKITKLVGKGAQIAQMLSADGADYSHMIMWLGSPIAVYDYLSALASLIDNLGERAEAQGTRFTDNWPWLRQEGEEGEIWNGQPVVCDGWFEMKEGELWFSGNEFTHGGGKKVSRKIRERDIIVWYRCEDMSKYKGGEL